MNFLENDRLVPVEILHIHRLSTDDPSSSVVGTLVALEVTT